MLAAEDQQTWPAFLDDLPQDDRRRSKPNLQRVEDSIRNRPLQDLLDPIARNGLLKELHLGDLRIGIHSDERRPRVTDSMDQLAANTRQFCNALGERGCSRRRGRGVNARNNRSPGHHVLR